MRWPEYPAHKAFIAPARERSSLVLFAIALCATTLGTVALTDFYFDIIYAWAGDQSWQVYEECVTGETPRAMFIQLFLFGLSTLALSLSVVLINRRSFDSLLGPWHPFVYQFLRVLGMLGALSVLLYILPPWGVDQALVPNLELGAWARLLPLSLLAVLVQVSAEEVFFRGYIQQQLAARFASPFVWMILPSVAFGMLHYAPDSAGDNAMLIVIWAGVFGMLMADLTARAGTLGPAIALHFVNNVSAILIVSVPDNMFGLALYLTPFSMADTVAMRAWLPVDFATMLVFWLGARVAIRR